MNHTTQGAGASGLACEVCGRLPHPRKLRLTLAKLTAVLPIELLLHALVIYFHMSYALTVILLSVATTVLVIWGSLEAITHELAALRATILDLRVYPLSSSARDERQHRPTGPARCSVPGAVRQGIRLTPSGV